MNGKAICEKRNLNKIQGKLPQEYAPNLGDESISILSPQITKESLSGQFKT